MGNEDFTPNAIRAPLAHFVPSLCELSIVLTNAAVSHVLFDDPDTNRP